MVKPQYSGNLRGITCRVVLFDEASTVSITEEGSPIKLAEARTSSFGDDAWLYFKYTLYKDDLINSEYNLCDKRRWFVLACGHDNLMGTSSMRIQTS
ncbi:phage terminase large subunit family protein (plasmid) [Pseudomonas marginalis]|uniref:phage terminase large subunit family protein n=1 Tax=Pseudomonas marginalis TaxID=298 RepID=UPI003866E8E8